MISTTEKAINIKRIVIDEPRAAGEIPFDPRRDITEKQWGNVEEFFRNFDGGLPPFLPRIRYIYALANLTFLSPQRAKDLFDQEKWEGTLKDVKKESNPWLFVWGLRDLTLTSGDRSLHRELVNGERWEKIEKALPSVNSTSSVEIAAALKLAVPEKAEEFKMKEAQWKETENELLLLRDTDDWQTFTRILASVKIVDPERARKFLSEDAWQNMKTLHCKYEEMAITKRDQLIHLLSSMAILAADEVQTTEDGVKLIMPNPKILSDNQQLPEVRRF